MRKSRFDAIVVGGGPAGSAASFALASKGLSVCLIDKSAFPRDKLCGGMLTLRSKAIFEKVFLANWDPIIETVATGCDFYHKGTLLNSVRDYKETFFTSRYSFDAFLLALSESQGVYLIQNAIIKDISLDSNSLILNTGPRLYYDFLIGADGVHSLVARKLFGRSFMRNRIALGLQMDVPVDNRHKMIPHPEIYFGVVKWGYGWVFPKATHLTVGMGGLLSQNSDLKCSLLQFLRQRFDAIPDSKISGHYIPCGDYRKVPGKDNVLLCGDAAGLVDPITGEGIAYAMESGHYAAQAVFEAYDSGKAHSAYAQYITKYRSIQRSLSLANILRYLIFPRITGHLFIKALPKTNTIPKKHIDLMSGDVSYESYVQFLARKLSSALLKTIFRVG